MWKDVAKLGLSERNITENIEKCAMRREGKTRNKTDIEVRARQHEQGSCRKWKSKKGIQIQRGR